MAYYNTYQMPNAFMTQPTYSQQPTYGNIVWVQGRASAEIYPIAPGNKVMLMDSNEPIIYVKEADATGKLSPMKIYDLVERKDVIAPSEEVKAASVDYDKIKEIIKEETTDIDYDKIKDMITTEVCAQIDNLTVSTTKKGDK